jgi:O-antigen/teichoic acid export membrane protein
MFATGGATMVGSLIAQVALGWLLSDEDFGVYALAIGFSTFLLVFKDAGVRLWLLRQSREEFQRIMGDSFWLSLGFSLLVALLLAGLSPLIGRVYQEPRIVPVILVLAAATPLSAYPKIASAWLLVDLRFVTNARIEIVSATLRYILMVGLAFLGFGPLSFALPVIAVNLYEGVAGWVTTHLRPWRSPFSSRQIFSLFRESRWPMAGSLAEATTRQSDYVALGIVATTGVVGVYFFAYQFSVRLLNLFSESLRKVIVPVFSTAASEPDRQRDAAMRGSTFLGLVAAPVFILLAVVAAPLETLLWQARWADAVPAIQLLAAVFPIHLLARFVDMIMQAQGRFRVWTAATALRGIGLAGAALLSGFVGGRNNATVVALVIAVYVFLSGLIEITVLAGRVGVSNKDMLRKSIPPYVFAVLIGAVVLFMSGKIGGLQAIAQLGILGVVYGAAYLAGIALLFRSSVRSVQPILRQLPGWRTFSK